jgi:hypothetical protein
MARCRIERIKPNVLVCLGATAAQVLLGNKFRGSMQRARPIESPLAPKVMATVHPSSLLRIVDDDERHREMKRFVEDIKKVAKFVKWFMATEKAFREYERMDNLVWGAQGLQNWYSEDCSMPREQSNVKVSQIFCKKSNNVPNSTPSCHAISVGPSVAYNE